VALSVRTRPLASASGLLAAGLAAAAVGLAQHATAPLYDGIGFPDQPCRYFPADADGVPVPRPASSRLHLNGGRNDRAALLGTDEQGPQVVVYIPVGALAADRPDAVGFAAVQVRPVVLSDPPTDGIANSNAYRISIAATSGPLHIRPRTESGIVTLREATLAQPSPQMEYRPQPAARWRPLPTTRSGRDTFDGLLQGPGDYLLVRAAATPDARGGGSHRGPLLALAGTAGLLALTLLGIRLLTRAQP
jgi:hypothetical protein